MGEQISFAKKRKIEKIAIVILCSVVMAAIVAVMLFAYRPNQNSLGALASVCMDIISIIVLIILVFSLGFEKDEPSKTTRLFLGLMIGTVWAMFWDFMNWAADGSLKFDGYTYVFTVLSLCMGSILAGIFVLYLASYFADMYKMDKAFKIAKVCAICNGLASCFTLWLALTKQAFTYVDGHYEIGAMYELVEIVPIVTLLCMAVYAIVHIKTIGFHDLMAVIGYILIMIVGALIESAYRIGATYVAITIADVFIYVMLQSKLLNRVKQQKDLLTEEIRSQYAILDSMAGIYSYVDYIDFEEKTLKRFDVKDSVAEPLNLSSDSHTTLNKELLEGIEADLRDRFWKFTDLSTLSERMSNEKIISAEFCHKEDGWFRAAYIRIGDSTEKRISKVIYAIRNIDEEKKNVEKWIHKSNTDELTGFFNRNAYEDEIALIGKEPLKENLVYVSVDVNSLKIVNDTLGHDAGDELILGACECLRQCLGSYGKLYRTGGDEFVALIYTEESQLDDIKKDIEEVSENWKGKFNASLAMSCGFVSAKEEGIFTIHHMALLADKRMYEEKNQYYRRKGIDRRGQRDAHVALCALYTKILRVNITDDTYQIVNMNESERNKEKGFTNTLSQWLVDFGTSGQVHPEDLEDYLVNADIEQIRKHFKNSKSSYCMRYRRKDGEVYKMAVMEMIPANDYTDEVQRLFLYVRNIE